jgi:hypothetical protein
MVPNSLPATKAAIGMEKDSNGPVILNASDSGAEAGYMVYVYNVLNLPHSVEQPPLFPHFNIPACPEGERFAVTFLPAFVNERYEKAGSLPVEFYYKKIDGRRCATSLLNPSAFPGTDFESQLKDWRSIDQTGNNLNVFGVFWSLTPPDSPELEKELKLFRDRAQKTMADLIRQGEQLAAAGQLNQITPLMHFAMDYTKRSAAWHMSHKPMIDCPNCGEAITANLIYHKNQFGEKCIIDPERYAQVVAKNETPAAAEPRKQRKARKPKAEAKPLVI